MSYIWCLYHFDVLCSWYVCLIIIIFISIHGLSGLESRYVKVQFCVWRIYLSLNSLIYQLLCMVLTHLFESEYRMNHTFLYCLFVWSSPCFVFIGLSSTHRVELGPHLSLGCLWYCVFMKHIWNTCICIRHIDPGRFVGLWCWLSGHYFRKFNWLVPDEDGPIKIYW